MKAAKDQKKGTDPHSIGSEKDSPVQTVVLLGAATQTSLETPEIVAERYQLSLEVKRAERRLAVIDAILKANTGERQVGAFIVNYSSFNRESVDTDKVREILGDKTPIKFTPSGRLTVVPA